MANRIIGPAFSILAAFLLVASTVAGSDGPFIVAHKKASLTRLNAGTERVSVSIDVYNQGSAYVVVAPLSFVLLSDLRFN